MQKPLALLEVREKMGWAWVTCLEADRARGLVARRVVFVRDPNSYELATVGACAHHLGGFVYHLNVVLPPP